ncbi:MAG: hypothetical protein GBAus27B_000282 [Mycoplasmataceae bacterium]|nr:MAG: hypothetical protein GBAus27B_000282 [Mycoplasmataceae bacterium]
MDKRLRRLVWVSKLGILSEELVVFDFFLVSYQHFYIDLFWIRWLVHFHPNINPYVDPYLEGIFWEEKFLKNKLIIEKNKHYGKCTNLIRCNSL